MNYQEFRLIEVLENFDKIINKSIILFRLTPMFYKDNASYFRPDSDDDITLVYINSEEIEDYFMSRKDETISIDIDNFKSFLMIDDEGNLKKTLFENDYYSKRQALASWQIDSKKNIDNNYKIGFKFSHYQCCFFDFGDDYDEINNRSDIEPSTYTDNNIIVEKESYIIFSKSDIFFIEKGENRNITIISGAIKNIIYQNNKIKKIETVSRWASHNSIKVIFEFDTQPLKFLEKTEKNIIISIIGNGIQSPPIKTQFSLMFGKDMGIVKME